MTQDIQDRIDRYVLNKLTADERKTFEKEMRADEKLREEVELTMLITEGLRRKSEQDAINKMQHMEEAELKEILFAAESKYKQDALTEKNKSAQRKGTVRILAAITVAAACLLAYIAFQPKYSSEKLFAEYFKVATYQPLRGDYGMDDDREASAAKAFASYQNGDYSNASNAFSKAMAGLKMQDVPDDVIFYFAVSLAETGQYDKAIEKFNYLVETANPEYGLESEWNLALVYLKSNLRNDTEKTLRNTINHNGPFAPMAKELLDKVTKKKWQIF